jgi:hypothetical protein
MKRNILMLVLFLGLVLVPTAGPLGTASAAPEPQFIFCYSASINPSLHQWFYSDIFQGDPANGIKMGSAFGGYLRTTYPDRNTGPAGCRFFGSAAGAKSDKRTLQSASNADSVETGWTYSH